MSYPSYVHDPDAHLDYLYDWTDWLAEGDTIAASEWIVPDDLTADDESFTDTTATVWISGGTAGSNYTVTNRVTTAAGRIDDRSITLKCKER